MASLKNIPLFTILVAGLGYVVDIFDLLLFGLVRVSSLTELGVSGDQLLSVGANVMNAQMAGLLIGSIFWGVLGDRVGRAKVMFWSISVYSIATLLCSFVDSVWQYGCLRFITGFGLSAEFGIAITLAVEISKPQWRGYAAMFVATLGTVGYVSASAMAQSFYWRDIYMYAGLAGLALMGMRYLVMESQLFQQILASVPSSKRGNFKIVFKSRVNTLRYAAILLFPLALPFMTQVVSVFSPEITRTLGAAEVLSAPQVGLFYGLGVIAGDIIWILVSQICHARKKVAFVSLALSFISMVVYLSLDAPDLLTQKIMFFFLGFLIVPPTLTLLMATEQFGTNVRAMTTTSSAGISRALSIVMVTAFASISASMGAYVAVSIVFIAVYAVAFTALFYVREGYGVSLDYIED